MRGWQALAIVPLATMLVAGPAFAQEGTPDAGGAEPPRLVDPSECKSEPRPFEEIAAVLNLDGDGIPEPPKTIQINAPLGEIVDSDTELAISEAAREFLACFNAGDVPRSAALMTENGIKRTFWGLTIDEENRGLARERIAAEPAPRIKDALARLIAVTDASTLPDGRIAAFVVINEPLLPPTGPETLLFIFANQDGQWLLDDYVDFSIVPPGFGEGTPTP